MADGVLRECEFDMICVTSPFVILPHELPTHASQSCTQPN